jgi:hypothetical protein
LSAESVLPRPIYQTLLKGGVGAALVAAQRRRLQAPRRILSLRGTRTQHSKDNENEFHGDDDISIKRKPHAFLVADSRHRDPSRAESRLTAGSDGMG